jgi:outer membrane immunogenic protein
MKRISLVGAVCVSAVLFAAQLGIANAADLAVKGPAPVPPAYNWTGFYIGAQGGYGWSYSEFDFPPTAFPIAVTSTWNSNSWVAGGVVGAQYELGASHIVVGIEGEWNAANFKGNAGLDPFGFAHSSSLDSFGSANAKLGWALVGFPWERSLLYVVGGAAWGDPKQTIFVPAGAAASFNGGQRTGWDIGAGIDFGLTPNWVLRGEWRMYGFNGSNVAPGAPFAAALGTNLGATHDTVNLARAGILYKF